MLEPTAKMVRLSSEEVHVKLLMLLGTRPNCCKGIVLLEELEGGGGVVPFNGGKMEKMRLSTENLSHSNETEKRVV